MGVPRAAGPALRRDRGSSRLLEAADDRDADRSPAPAADGRWDARDMPTCRCRSCTSTPIRRPKGSSPQGGPLVVRTGQHTGRSPQDKYLVDAGDAHAGVWWGGFNQPISEERYDALRQRMIDHLATRELFVRDCYVGAHPRWRRSVRAYTETAWASIFCSNLFRTPPPEDLPGSRPTSPSSTRPASAPTRSVTGSAARRSSSSTWVARRSSSAARSTPAR